MGGRWAQGQPLTLHLPTSNLGLAHRASLLRSSVWSSGPWRWSPPPLCTWGQDAVFPFRTSVLGDLRTNIKETATWHRAGQKPPLRKVPADLPRTPWPLPTLMRARVGVSSPSVPGQTTDDQRQPQCTKKQARGHGGAVSCTLSKVTCDLSVLSSPGLDRQPGQGLRWPRPALHRGSGWANTAPP